MSFISITEEVSKLVKFNNNNERHSLNILPIFVTFFVLKLSIYNDLKLLQK